MGEKREEEKEVGDGAEKGGGVGDKGGEEEGG